MLILRYIVSAIASFSLNIFVMLTAWFWALIPAIFGLDNLPGILWYLQTHDDNVYGEREYGPRPKGRVKLWWTATCWLMRNPGYAFDAHVLGFSEHSVVRKLTTGTSIESGYHDRFWLIDGAQRFGYRRDLHWLPKGIPFYMKMQFGWHRAPRAGYHMLKFDVHPFKRIKD